MSVQEAAVGSFNSSNGGNNVTGYNNGDGYNISFRYTHLIELILAFQWFLFCFNWIYIEKIMIFFFFKCIKSQKCLSNSLNILQYYIILINMVVK